MLFDNVKINAMITTVFDALTRFNDVHSPMVVVDYRGS